jgi:hypothetical protein
VARKAVGYQDIENLASRRAGATYQDLYRAAKERLKEHLRNRSPADPPELSQFTVISICTCIEVHLKSFYAHAVHRFRKETDIVRDLTRSVEIDINTIVPLNGSRFEFGDVVAASIKVSSLESYLKQASHFFTSVLHERYDFPWDRERIFTECDPDYAKEMAGRIARLSQLFRLRHRIVHEVHPAERYLDAPSGEPSLNIHRR